MLEGLVRKLIVPAEVNVCQQNTFKMLESFVGKLIAVAEGNACQRHAFKMLEGLVLFFLTLQVFYWR